MADAALSTTIPRPRAAQRRFLVTRVVIYGLLGALRRRLPACRSSSSSSTRSATLPEIAEHGLIAFPRSFSFDAWREAWCDLLHRRHLRGDAAQLLQLALDDDPGDDRSRRSSGAMNGYVLSKWRFRGSEVLFTCMLFGVFMPGQIALMPWAFILGNLGLSQHHRRAGAGARGPGHLLHHALLPQLLRRHPRRPDQGGAHRRRRLLAHLLQDRPAAVAADPDRHGDLAVHRHLERVPLRRRLHLRRGAADHRGAGGAVGAARRTCATTT